MDVATSNPLTGDIDGDGLTNQQKVYTYGTNPFHSDTDGDGIDDLYEVISSILDPLFSGDALQDPDSDNLVNLWEFKLGLNEAVADLDTDGDGLVDGLENYLGSQFSSILADTDGNGISDANGDHDSDGLTTIMEFSAYGTDGSFHDSDGDTLPDGWEIQHGFDALISHSSGPQSPGADPDNDGLTNYEESIIGTDPNNSDTDGDGVNDKVEYDQGSDPNDPNDNMPPENGITAVTFEIGDPNSGSSSEKYKIVLTPLAPEGDGRVRSRINSQYGIPEVFTFILPKGTKYTVELFHVDTNRDPFVNKDELGLPGQGNPDPRGVFADHCIVEYQGEYYDPSYGIPKRSSKIDWEDSVIAGFGVNVGEDSSGDTVYWFDQDNPIGTLELNINP